MKKLLLCSVLAVCAVVGAWADKSPKSIEVNGSNVWKNSIFTGPVSGISWNVEYAHNIKFNVASGAWSFSARAY